MYERILIKFLKCIASGLSYLLYECIYPLQSNPTLGHSTDHSIPEVYYLILANHILRPHRYQCLFIQTFKFVYSLWECEEQFVHTHRKLDVRGDSAPQKKLKRGGNG